MAIGQKLEEARNRKGISIREASESTKIRGDYLSAFEAGQFDIDLPEVYLRGFIRLYSRFLDLDQEAMLADLDLELGNSSTRTQKNHWVP
jgi:cytoskeleton protein RodZ